MLLACVTDLCLFLYCRRHRNNRYRMRLLSFLSKKVVSTNWRIYKGVLVGPRLKGKEFRAVSGSANCFFQLQNLKKNLYRDLKRKKSFVKEGNPSQWALLRKAMILGTEYMQKSSFKNTFSTLLCKPKQNTTSYL
jgi:hypothetical protein